MKKHSKLAIISSILPIIYFISLTAPVYQFLCFIDESFNNITELYWDITCDSFSLLFILIRISGGPLAIILGLVALRKIRQNRDHIKGTPFAWFDIVGGIVSFYSHPFWWAYFFIPLLDILAM
jgi:hypothetical protein